MNKLSTIYNLTGFNFLKKGEPIKIGKVMEQNDRLCIYMANNDCVIQICEDTEDDFLQMKE